jgi:hypothetical protein
MVQPGGHLDLPQEPLRPQRGGQLGLEDLEGDGAVVLEIGGEVDGGHAAAAELALDGVAVGQRFPEAVQILGHGTPWSASRCLYDRVRDGGRPGRAG